MTEIRIGGGVPLASAPPPKPTPRRWPFVIGAVAVVVLIAGVSYAIGATGKPAARGTQIAWSPEPTPPRPRDIGEQATCNMLIPTLKEATDVVLELAEHPDGSTLDASRAQRVADDLETIGNAAPADMAADIEAQRRPLQQIAAALGGSGDIDLDMGPFKDAGRRLAIRCLKYAT